MAKILDMPKLSPTMEEGVLSAWHKKEGDAVGVDDLLAEVETDKATMEFRSFDKGTLLKVLVAAGTPVKLGQAVAILGNPGDDIQALLVQAGGTVEAKPETEASPSAPAAVDLAPAAVAPPAPVTQPAVKREIVIPKQSGSVLTRTEREPSRTAADPARILASPYVRKTAREMGIDLQAAKGTGPHGRIAIEDLEAMKSLAPLAIAPKQALATIGLAPPEARPLSPMRKTIARRLTESKQTVPHFYLTIDIDAEPLTRFREDLNKELEHDQPATADSKPLKVSVNDILIKACALALDRVPECNASFTPDALLIHRRVDISVAVAIADGLVTPVVRDADKKSIVAISKEVRELASRARNKKLRPEEMMDGTFSISNLGMFGIDAFSAVIKPPEGAILAIGQVREEPVVKNGGIVAGRKLSMTLSCDHRVVDGAVGASFLAELRSLLARPMRILTG